MATASPLSSPRAFSPPPAAEIQLGPKSPAMVAVPGSPAPEVDDTAKLNHGAMRRIRPGTKAADMASGPPLIPLTELDSPFQLQEHLNALHHHHTRTPNDSTSTQPLSHDSALQIATPPPNIDRSLWLYELCRFLVQHTNIILVYLMTKEEPKCTASTCPEMRASEWQYLCAVHEPPKPCCAIDYCNHTLDWASDTLTASKNFPSRLTLGSAASGGSQQGVRHLTNIMRRVYRIFAHAWFQHREGVFWPIEGQGGLYTLFKTVCDVYSLIPEENYTIPPEAEGLSSDSAEDGEEKTVLKKDDEEEGDEDATTTLPAAATTRRHKHTPSVGSVVPTIAEGDEDDHERESPLAQISKSAESVEKKPASPDKRAATEEVADVEKGGEGLGGKAHEEKGPGGKAHEEEEPRGKAHEEEGPRGKAHEEEGPGPEVFETET